MVFWRSTDLSTTGKRAALIAVLVSSISGSAAGQAITTGQTLKERCATVQLTAPSAGLVCRGYIGAVVDILADGNTVNGYRACPPSTDRREDLVKAVKAWLDKHPEALPVKASQAVAEALAKSFPCPIQK